MKANLKEIAEELRLAADTLDIQASRETMDPNIIDKVARMILQGNMFYLKDLAYQMKQEVRS